MDKKVQVNCYNCNEDLIWGGDHDYEDCQQPGKGIVTNLSCSNCDAFVLVYMPIGEE